MRTKRVLLSILMLLFLAGFAMVVIGGNLNPTNTPAPTMRTLDELYKNIQPGLPSDWRPYPLESQTTGADAVHLWIEGGFPIAGSCTAQQKENSIVVVGLGHEVDLPYDPSSGAATGHLVHSPLVITKCIDKSSPQLYRACAEGRAMDLTLRFYRTAAHGQEEQYYTIEMHNARIVNIRMAFPNIEQVSFVYETIRWRYERDGIEFEGRWSEPRVSAANPLPLS